MIFRSASYFYREYDYNLHSYYVIIQMVLRSVHLVGDRDTHVSRSIVVTLYKLFMYMKNAILFLISM